ncbi:MAG: hypothetical protein WC728_15570 [Elusimicrobiota bacterium]
MIEPRLQNFIIARLAEYCDFRRRSDAPDPILYLWEKLKEIEAPLQELKGQVLEDAVRGFLKKAEEGSVTESLLADFKQLLESYLSAGDFVDAVFLLDMPTLQDPSRRSLVTEHFARARAYRKLDEELKPPEKRNKAWERLVSDICRRLRFDLIEVVLKHKPLTERRLRFILRRIRFNTADYCAVFHFPINADDTFTPFILPRVEALIAANQRLIRRLRQR